MWGFDVATGEVCVLDSREREREISCRVGGREEGRGLV